MNLLGEGGKAVVPHRLMFHIIAVRYGTTAEAVRSWPADDFLDACAFLKVTGGK